MTKSLESYTRFNAETFKELRKGDMITYVGYPDMEAAQDLTVGKTYEVTEGFGEDGIALVILGGIVKFTDDAGDGCMLHDVNCEGFAKEVGANA